MASGFLHYKCCLIILTVFVDWGDGRWKKKDRENLQDDIDLFRKMADKIKIEIEAFYDEYPDEKFTRDDVGKIHHKYEGSSSNGKKTGFEKQNQEKQGLLPVFNETTKDLNSVVTKPDPEKAVRRDFDKTKNVSWPKFEDILLAMGRRYDWKNDRWIKVKRKLKEIRSDNVSDNSSLDFHVKHKFYYRIVKLNKSKSRRNVVVSVSAVR